jgi:hypothetical protein
MTRTRQMIQRALLNNVTIDGLNFCWTACLAVLQHRRFVDFYLLQNEDASIEQVLSYECDTASRLAPPASGKLASVLLC